MAVAINDGGSRWLARGNCAWWTDQSGFPFTSYGCSEGGSEFMEFGLYCGGTAPADQLWVVGGRVTTGPSNALQCAHAVGGSCPPLGTYDQFCENLWDGTVGGDMVALTPFTVSSTP